MKNKKGMTIVELLLSIILISIVLIFIIQLCLRARNTYLNNNFNVKYELSRSIIIDAVMDDYIKKDIRDINLYNNNITFTFEDGTSKVLSVVENSNSTFLIKYSGATDSIISREYQNSDVEYKGITWDDLSTEGNILHRYKLNLVGKDGFDYSLDIYFYL